MKKTLINNEKNIFRKYWNFFKIKKKFWQKFLIKFFLTKIFFRNFLDKKICW